MNTYCPLCSRPTGTGHEPWCPSNDDITCAVWPGGVEQARAAVQRLAASISLQEVG